MDEVQARRVLRRYGWTAVVRVIKVSGQRHLIARKRIEGRLVSVHISSLRWIHRFEQIDIERKLPDVDSA